MADEISAAQLQAAMLSATKQVNDFASNVGQTNQQYTTILQQLKQLNENFKTEFESAAQYLKKMVSSAVGKSGGGSKGLKVSDPLTQKALLKLVKCVCKKEKDLDKWAEDFEKSIEDFDKSTDKAADALESAAESLKDSAEKQKVSDKAAEAILENTARRSDDTTKKIRDNSDWVLWEIKNKVINFIVNTTKNFQDAMFGMDEKMNMLGREWNPLEIAKQEQKFNREIKQTAFDIDNVTAKSKGMQKAFIDIGKTVQETGVTRTEYQEAYTKNLKVGIKDLRVVQKLTTQTLGTERLLGMEAGGLADHFRDLNQFGRLNLAQTGAIGRGMIEVAKTTGITGDRMKGIVDKAKAFNDQLIKTANFTAAASKNILEIVANAEKFGVGDSVGNILKVATSTNELINSANSETSRFLYAAAGQMGKIQQLQYGTITRSKKGIKDLSLGMEKVLQKFGVESIEAVENLTDEQKFKLNIQLKAAYGMELGEVVRTIDAFKQSGKGAAEQLEEIAKKQKQNLNIEEKTALMEQQRRIKASAAMGVVTALSEAAKGAKDMNEALAKFDRRKDEFSADIKAIGGDLSNTTSGVGFAYKAAADQLNAKLKELGKEPIQIDGKDIEKALKDKDAQAMLAERLEKGFQVLQQAEKNAADPATGSYQTLLQVNDSLKNFIGPAVNLLTGILGELGMITLAIGALGVGGLASAYGGIQDFTRLFGELGDHPIFSSIGESLKKLPGAGMISKMFEKGGPTDTESPVQKAEKSEKPKAETKTQEAEKGGKKSGKKAGKSGPKDLIPDIDWKQVKKELVNLGKMLTGVVAAIALVGLAIIAIAAVVATVNKAIKINPLLLAWQITQILGAAAIIGTEVALAYLGLKKFRKTYGKYLNKDNARAVALTAKDLLIMTAAIVGLATAILVVGTMASFGMSASTAANIASNILAVMLAATTIIVAVAAAAYGLKLLGKQLDKIAQLTPEVVRSSIVAALILPVLVLAIVGLAALIMFVSNLVMGAFGLDIGKITQTVVAVNILVWGFTLLLLGLVTSALMIVGLAWAITALLGTAAFWPWIGMALAVLGVVALGLVGMLFILGSFCDKILSSTTDPSDLSSKIEKVLTILDAVNGIMLRLAPLVLLCTLLGVFGGLLVAASPAIQAGAAVGIIVAVILMAVLPLLVFALSGIAKAVILSASKAAGINPEEARSAAEKVTAVADAAWGIIKSLAPLAAIVLGMTALLAGFGILAFFGGAKIIAAAFSVVATTLPILIGAILLVGIAIISAVQKITSGFKFDESMAKELTDKIWLLSSTTMELSGALMSLSVSAYMCSLAAAAAVIPMILFAAASLLVFSELIIAVGVLKGIQNIMNKFSVAEFFELGMKIQLFATSMMVLNAGFYAMAAAGASSIGLALGLAAYSLFLYLMKSTIQEIIIQYIGIGAYVYAASRVLPLQQVNAAFERLLKFTINLSNFITQMKKTMPSGTVFSSMTSVFVTQSPADRVKEYMAEIGQILRNLEGQGNVIDHAKLDGSVALFETLAKWAKNFSAAMAEMVEAEKLMSKTILGSIGSLFSYSLQTVVEEKLTTMNSLIDLVNKKSTTFDPEKVNMSVAYMEEMARVMKHFGNAMQGLGEGMATAGEMQKHMYLISTKNWYGKTVDSTLNKTVGSTMDAINSLTKVIESKIPDDSNFSFIVAKLSGMAPVMKILGETMSSFGTAIQGMFQQTFLGFGTQGPGAYVAENKEYIKKSMGDMFTAMSEIFSSMKKKFEDEKTMFEDVAIVRAGLRTLAKELKKINPDIATVNTSLTSFIQSKQNYENLSKTIKTGQPPNDDVTKTLSAMSGMMGPLTSVFTQFSENLAPLTNRGMFGFSNSIADDIAAQAGQITTAVAAVGRLVYQIHYALSFIGGVKEFEEANTKMKLMSDMVANLSPILENFNLSMTKLTGKFGKGKSLVDFTKELSSSLVSEKGGKGAIPDIFDILYKNIVDPLLSSGYDADGIKVASQMMKDMGTLLEGLSTSLNIINTSLLKTTQMGGPDKSLAGKVNKQLTDSKEVFASIMKSLKELVDEIWKIGPSTEVQEAGKILQGIGVIMDELAGNESGKQGLIQTLNTRIAVLTEESSSWGKPPSKSKLRRAEDAIWGLSVSLQSIMPAMTLLIDAIWDVGPSREVNEAAEILKGLTNMLNALAGEEGQAGLIETITTKMEDIVESVSVGKQVQKSELDKAGEYIKQLSLGLPSLLENMSKLIDVLIEKVGPATDVKMAAETLQELPKFFLGVKAVSTFIGGGLFAGLKPFDMQNNSLMQSMNSISLFLKVLNSGFITGLIGDAASAINKLSSLDQSLLQLAGSFFSIGGTMKGLGSMGGVLSLAGESVSSAKKSGFTDFLKLGLGPDLSSMLLPSAGVSPIASKTNATSAAGLTAPGQAPQQKMQMNYTNAGSGSSDIASVIKMLTASFDALANKEDQQIGHLAAINDGINGPLASRAAASSSSTTGNNSNTRLQLGGNSSDPTMGVGYNGGQPR
jgi:hypothetical protein